MRTERIVRVGHVQGLPKWRIPRGILALECKNCTRRIPLFKDMRTQAKCPSELLCGIKQKSDFTSIASNATLQDLA